MNYEDNNEVKAEDRGRRKAVPFIISIAVLTAVVVLAIVFRSRIADLFRETPDTPANYGAETLNTDTSDDTAEPPETDDPTKDLPDNPVDFDAQKEINEDIYAWIYVKDTDINYPILQSREDDLYYLRRGLDKNYDISGVIFTQLHNKRDFSDPVTLVYGHNMTGYDVPMFATLHNFEDEEFFNSHDTFYIYIPGHILTYEIVSAYKYDNRHIMNFFNFDDEEVRADYFDSVLHPTMIPMMVRAGATLDVDDKLVVLSTCMPDNTFRYLVNGVLVKDEPTK